MTKTKTDFTQWESNGKKTELSIGHISANKKKRLSGFNTLIPYFDNLINPIFKSKA